MIRNFFKVWIFVCLPTILIIFFDPFGLTGNILRYTATPFIEKISRGTFSLIENKLSKHPEEEWKSVFDDFTKDFYRSHGSGQHRNRQWFGAG